MRAPLPILAVAAIGLAALPQEAAARSITFLATVQSVPTQETLLDFYMGSDPAPDFGMPALGRTGTVTLSVDDSLLGAALVPGVFDGLAGGFSVRASLPGYLSSDITSGSDAFYGAFGSLTGIFASDEGATSYLAPLPDGTELAQNGTGDGIDAVQINYGKVLDQAPATLGDMLDALSLPGATGIFDADLGGWPTPAHIRLGLSVMAAPVGLGSKPPVPLGGLDPAPQPLPVPLPATAGLLLLGAAAVASRAIRKPAA